MHDEYFLLVQPRQDELCEDLLPSLCYDEASRKILWRNDAISDLVAPLRYTNAAKDYRQRRGHTTMRHPPQVLFDGHNPLVSTELRDALVALTISDLVTQSACYIDQWGDAHNGYWRLAFKRRRHCLQRWRMGRDATREARDELRMVSAFLESHSLPQLLLFQVTDDEEGFVVAHQSIAELFADLSGVQVLALRDYPSCY
jgi:hypothetical protein